MFIATLLLGLRVHKYNEANILAIGAPDREQSLYMYTCGGLLRRTHIRIFNNTTRKLLKEM